MTKAANPVRGEISLTLGGKVYRLRPSFAAIQAIEAKTGASLKTLASGSNRMELALSDMGTVAVEMIRAGADEGDSFVANVDPGKIAEMIFEAGVAKIAPVITVALMAALTGGVTASGEVAAKVAKGTTTDA